MKKNLLLTILSASILLAGNSPYDTDNVNKNHSNFDKVLFGWDMYDAYEAEKKRQKHTEEKRLKEIALDQEKNSTNR